MISRSLILLILQAVKIMREFFYEASVEIMQIYTTKINRGALTAVSVSHLLLLMYDNNDLRTFLLNEGKAFTGTNRCHLLPFVFVIS